MPEAAVGRRARPRRTGTRQARTGKKDIKISLSSGFPCKLTAMRSIAWLLVPIALAAADWTQFRGPNGAGVSPSKDLPEHFDSQKNIVWRVALPPGHSSPVLTADHIFITAFEAKDYCSPSALDRASGKVMWRREAPRDREEYFQPTNGPATPSPVTDGANVYVFFGDFGLLSYGPDGNERWRLPLGPFNNPNGHGRRRSWPMEGWSLVAIRTPGRICLPSIPPLDAFCGRRCARNTRADTPRPRSTGQRHGPAELIVPGSFEVASYALDTGEKLWWVRGMAWQLKCVPLIDGDRIFVNGWKQAAIRRNASEVPEFTQMLAEHDKDKDGKLSQSEMPPGFTAEVVRRERSQP